VDSLQSTILVHSGGQFFRSSKQKEEKIDERWERNSEREYVLRYLYLTQFSNCAFDSERSSNIHKSVKGKEIYSEKEALKGWYVRYSDFHISINSSAPEGGIGELWEI